MDKHRWASVLPFLLLVGVVLAVPCTALAQKAARIGVVIDGPSEYYQALGPMFSKEVGTLMGGEFEISVDDDSVVTCNYDKKCVDAAFDRLFADKTIDIVIGQGLLASSRLLERKQLPKASLATFVIDPRTQGLDPTKLRPNLAWLLWEGDIARELRLMAQLVPIKKVAALVSRTGWRDMPSAIQTHFEKEASISGVELRFVQVGPTSKDALASIPDDVDAVYVGTILDMPFDEQEKLAAGLAQRKLPSFCWAGERCVERGFLMGTTPKEDAQRLARRFALAVQSLLLGEDPETLRSTIKRSEKLFINGPLAQELGLSPDIGTLLETKLIGGNIADAEQEEARATGKLMTLRGVVQTTLTANLSLAAAQQAVRVSGEEARRARSSLLPQAGVSVGGRIIDEDRAFGIERELQANWTATASQSVFNERLWGSFGAAKHLVRAEEEKREQVRLDIVANVAMAYLQLLEASTAERIQEEDLRLSKQNLDMARVRARVGQAGREEVFRWETRIAQSRITLLGAIAARHQARVRLNILMNRPGDAPLQVEQLDRNSNVLLGTDDRFERFLASPKLFLVLQDFSVREGLARSPELRALASQTASVKRSLTAEKRSYFLPSIDIDGSFRHRFAQSEATPIPGLNFNPDDFDWQVGATASLPLFEGGLRDASISKGQAQIGQLTLEQQSYAREIESSVRQAVYAAAASHAGIDIAEQAKVAAHGNLTIVQDKYQRGRATIIELVDAQNESVVAQNNAANSVFAFLGDLVAVERAMGRFSFFETEQDNEAFIQRLQQTAKVR